jgi:hypothetical protein
MTLPKEASKRAAAVEARKKYMAVYRYTAEYQTWNTVYYLINKEALNERGRRYYRAHNQRMREYEQERKLLALKMVANGKPIECANCGCNDLRFLEINHKNGGGLREYKAKGITSIAWQIRTGKRGVSDLDIRCKVCNALYAVEMKFPDVKGKLRVEWGVAPKISASILQ